MTYVGAAGYALVGLLYAVVSVLAVTSWRGARVGGLLIVACIISTIWAGTLAFDSAALSIHPLAMFVVEVLRTGWWIVFLVALDKRRGIAGSLMTFFQALWLGLLGGGVLWWLFAWVQGRSVDLTAVQIPGSLALSLAGLVLIEQFYRNSVPEARKRIKALALSLGGLFAYDLFLYSQGMLFGSIDETAWQARGFVNVFFVPMIAIAARRNDQWDLDIFVSRQVVFYTTSLIAVGVYLLVMSAGGYLLILYGGNWGGLAQFIFFVGAIIVLASLLFSNSLRSRLKVFLSKHFFRNKYDYREEWLRLISTVSEFADHSDRQILIRALAQIVHSDSGVLWVRDATAAEFRVDAIYNTGDNLPPIPEDSPLMAFIESNHWLIDLDEYQQNPELYQNVLIPEWLATRDRSSLLVPLVIQRRVLGLVLLDRSDAPAALNYEDRDLLKTVGHHLAAHLAQQSADASLAEARQFEAYNRLTAFLMHDLNNLIAQQSMIVKNAERHKRNPEFVDDAMQTISSSVDRMRGVMSQLKRGESETRKRSILLKFIVSAAADRCAAKSPQPVLELAAADVELHADAERFIMVLTHLIRNAQDATPDDGRITVTADHDEQRATITVEDTGSGMSAEFIRDRLFRPFDSTKGSQGMGIGVYQAREFARQHGGDLLVESSPGQGTRFRLIFPLDRGKSSLSDRSESDA